MLRPRLAKTKLYLCTLAVVPWRIHKHSHILLLCNSPGAEGAMEDNMNNQGRGVLPRRTPSNSADAMGLWFAALVLCAVFAAGVMIYEGGNTDVVVTASNNAAAH
jgi:hypothetical protein